MIIDYYQTIQMNIGTFETFLEQNIIETELNFIQNGICTDEILQCTIAINKNCSNKHHLQMGEDFQQFHDNCTGKYNPDMGLGPFQPLFGNNIDNTGGQSIINNDQAMMLDVLQPNGTDYIQYDSNHLNNYHQQTNYQGPNVNTVTYPEMDINQIMDTNNFNDYQLYNFNYNNHYF